MGNHLVSSNIMYLLHFVSYYFHLCSFNIGPSDLLSVFRTWQTLLSGPLHYLLCSSIKVLSRNLLKAFSGLLKYHPKDTFPGHSIKKKKTTSAFYYSLNLLDFPSKLISQLKTMNFVFHWNVNLECQNLAFLSPVDITVLTAVPAT